MNNYVDRPLTFWETYNNLKYLYCSRKAHLHDFISSLTATNGGIVSFTRINFIVNYSYALRLKYLEILDSIYTEKIVDARFALYLCKGKIDLVVAYEAMTTNNIRDFIIYAKDVDLIKPFINILKENVWAPPYKITKITGFTANNGFPIKEDVEFNSEYTNIGLDSFYPFLNNGIDVFIKDFIKSKQNLLVLLGLPGTGKSSFIRHFLKKPNRVNVITNSHVLDDARLPNTFRDLNSKSLDDIEDVNQITIYEDADTFISPREGGNKQLSALLNHLEGIIPTNEKFIITANITNTDKIDSALLRPGRCYKVLFFDKLNPEQSNIAREYIGKSVIENLKDRLTLSEALNYEFVEELAIHKKAHIGF